MSAIVVLMAIFWVTEAIPLAITSLLPFLLFPLLGIMSAKEVAPYYINSTIFLFIGGFLIALAMERWQLHKRIAYKIISFFGAKPSNLILGFMSSAMILSMWVSNTATALIMLPIGLAVYSAIEDKIQAEAKTNLVNALLLGIAYSCSVGGLATLIGSPPNLVFHRFMQITHSDLPAISFGQWFSFGLPLALTMMLVIWFLLSKVFFRINKSVSIDEDIISKKYQELGKTSFAEKVVMTVFFSTAFLWIFRSDLQLGSLHIPGWANLIGLGGIDDGTIAIFAAVILFIMPSKIKEKPRILQKEILQKVPWGIVLLFGGGFALAQGFRVSNLDTFITQGFSGAANLPPLLFVFLISLAVSFLTEFTSNTASTHIILPILSAASVAAGLDPLLLLLPATFSASMAFMMPVATPPNAIVFSSEKLAIKNMVRVGFFLNVLGAMLVTLAMVLLGPLIFNIRF